MTLSWPNKEPTEVKDYEINWSAELGADTIATSSWSVPVGITQNSASSTTTAARIWLSGGTAGTSYSIINTITTSGGRTHAQEATLFVADRVALVVETGSGLSNSDSYATVAYADAYHMARGNAWTGSVILKEQALRRATAYMDGFSWAGYRSKGRLQALAWPRAGVVDVEGIGIAGDEIPTGVKNCCVELALRELAAPGVLAPDVKASDAVKREKIGPIEVEYSNPANTVSAARTMVSVIEPFLRGLLATGNSSSALSGLTVRA